MRKRFIVLVDLSEGSANLIKYASDWAIKVDAEILLVHQTIVVAPALTDVGSKEEMAQRANADARNALSSLTHDHIAKGLKVSYSVSQEHLQLTLPLLLDRSFEDLIFVGLKGTSLLKKLLVGSVALRIIDTTDNCVVAMPQEIDAFTQGHIHVSVTEKSPFNILAFNNYLKFIDQESVRIHFFYLAGTGEDTTGIEKQLRELSELFSHRYTTDHIVFEGANAFDDIKTIVKSRMDEVLVVQRGSRLLTDHLFRRFLINELVYEGQTPLVVLP